MKALTKSFALLLLVLAAATAGAQSFTGTVSGTVTDQQGAALPGATVTLVGKGAPRTTVSDGKGEYRFTAVDPGNYSVTVEMTGFQKKEIANIPVSIGKTAEAMAVCPECEADVEIDEYDVDKGEIISCPECGVELEVVGLAPLQLDVPQEEEDWTE